MGTVKRRPLQGILNIIRFNWHYYVLILLILTGMWYFMNHSPLRFQLISKVVIILGIIATFISLLVSFYIYDLSSFYSLGWMEGLAIQLGTSAANIHAGFDETSGIIASQFPGIRLTVYDFYDPVKHTEVSIRRARQSYPPFPGTKQIRTDDPEFPEKNLDFVFLIFAAHEIRDESERTLFFKTLSACLNKTGRILVVEHARDIVNFLAFYIGFLHFFSRKSWLRVFTNASLKVESRKNINPFVTAYILINS